jgi:hypothetical protein
MYFSGQGKLFIAGRDSNGNAQAFRYVGNVPNLEITTATETIEHKESTSGQRLTDARMITQKDVSISFPFDEFNIDNLAQALYGTKTTTAGSSVTGEVLPSGLAIGDYVRTKYPEISAVVVKDSAGSPATLVLGTDYEIASANHGTLKILNLGAYVQPFKVDYTYGAHDHVKMFSTTPGNKWLRFEGLNTADTDKPVLIELYNCLLDPTSLLAAINDEFGNLPIAGKALYDDTKVSDTYLGQFGRFVHI